MRFQKLSYALIALILLFLLLGPRMIFALQETQDIQSLPLGTPTIEFTLENQNSSNLNKERNFHPWLNHQYQATTRGQNQHTYSLYTSSGESVKISIPQHISTISGKTISEESPLFVNDLRGGDKVALQLQNFAFLRENDYLKEDKIRAIVLVGSRISHSGFALNPLTEPLIASLSADLTAFNCKIISTFTSFPFLAVELPYREIFNLASQNFVAHVFLDTKIKPCLDESVPLIKPPTEWNQLETQFGFPINGSGIRIAILDSGIDTNHPDLDDFDDDPATTDPKVIAEACFTGEGHTHDNRGHGTHCASIAAGTGNASGYQYVGVAPGAYLLNGKVIHDLGYGTTSWSISGIEWAISQSANIISISFGSDPWGGSGNGTDPLSLTVDWAVNQGAICTIAAGRYGSWGEFSIATPGVAKLAITVGATNQEDIVTPSSSRGPTGDFRLKPDVCAPGAFIIAARANNSDMGNPVNEYYTSASGTSMATPHVAGAAALILQTHPTWNPMMVKSALMGNAKPLENTVLWKQGAGRIQICEALNTSLLIVEPSTSLGAYNNTAINANATLLLMNLANAPNQVGLSTHTQCDQLDTNGVSVNVSSLSIPALANRSILLTVELDDVAPGGFYQGRVTFSTSQNNKTAPYFFIKMSPPNWNQQPTDQLAEYGYILQYALDASDRDGLDTWWVNDTISFSINPSGILTNQTELEVGKYGLQVWVNDTFNLILTANFSIRVQDTTSPVWITTPTDQVLTYGQPLGYRMYATDLSGINQWTVDDITHFSISSSGLLTNNLLLEPGDYSVTITVYDVHGNSLSTMIIITVEAIAPPPVPGYPWISILIGCLLAVVPLLILRSRRRPN